MAIAIDITPNSSRRSFLKFTVLAGAGLTLGVALPETMAAMSAPGKASGSNAFAPAFEPNAFVRIGSDNTVTVIAKHVELGQGTYTGLATLVAEELDAAWPQVRVEGAPADAARYGNLQMGGMQGTGGSTAIANSYEQMRKAGATARAMLVTAAASKWKVPADTIRVKEGVLSHPSGKKASFGELADAAASVAVPTEVKLKEPKDFVLIGTHVPRKDTRAKSTGSAQFTQDVNLPGMLTALVAHPPRFGAKVKRFDAALVQGIPGVRTVVEVPNGVAVLATDFWAAKKGRDALKVEWDETDAFRKSSTDIMADFKQLAASPSPGAIARNDGDAAEALLSAAKTIEAGYEFPYLAHAAMEPMNCVIKLDGDRCEVWNGEQFATVDQAAVAEVVGLKPQEVKVNMLFAGGSFGRRANAHSDYLREAAYIAKALAKVGQTGTPVKLVWTREDDMCAGYYRPMYYHALKAGLDASGAVIAWQHRIVGQSILGGTPFEAMMVKDGIDATSVEGASTLPYAIANLQVDLHSPKLAVPVLWWRSVGSTHTAYSTETMIDELAVLANKDPVEFRKALLGAHPRHVGVLTLAAQKADWGQPLAQGRGRGVAVHESFNTYVAQVAEVSVKPDNTFTVDRVVCAVDCGVAVNPDVIRAQMEGGIGFALTAARYGAITLKDGIVEQSNFNDYQPLRMHEMPKVEVFIVPSKEPPTGVGEPGVPPLAPAVANAIAAATGKRLRSLPLKLS